MIYKLRHRYTDRQTHDTVKPDEPFSVDHVDEYIVWIARPAGSTALVPIPFDVFKLFAYEVKK